MNSPLTLISSVRPQLSEFDMLAWLLARSSPKIRALTAPPQHRIASTPVMATTRPGRITRRGTPLSGAVMVGRGDFLISHALPVDAVHKPLVVLLRHHPQTKLPGIDGDDDVNCRIGVYLKGSRAGDPVRRDRHRVHARELAGQCLGT